MGCGERDTGLERRRPRGTGTLPSVLKEPMLFNTRLVPSAQQHLLNCAPGEVHRSRHGEPQCLSYFPVLRTQQRTTDLQTVCIPCGHRTIQNCRGNTLPAVSCHRPLGHPRCIFKTPRMPNNTPKPLTNPSTSHSAYDSSTPQT